MSVAETGSADRPTLDFYDAEAARYAAEVESLNDPAPLQRFMAELAPGGRVLDLGCGAGWASAMLAAAGFAVRAVDGSPGLVAEARARGVPAEGHAVRGFRGAGRL